MEYALTQFCIFIAGRVLPCGEPGSERDRHCQMFKLTLLSVLPGLILIARNAVNLADSFEVSLHILNKFLI